MGGLWKELTDPGFEYWDRYSVLCTRGWGENGGKNHRPRGLPEGLRLVACIMVDMADLSTLCAAQMEEIDSSKEVGSSMSAGTRALRSSTVRFGLELEVVIGWVDTNSGFGDGGVGVSNLTTGLAYGWERL